MEDEEEQNVVVVGKRIKDESPVDLGWGGLAPAGWVSTANWAAGAGGSTVLTNQLLGEDGSKIIRFDDFDFTVKIPAADWARLTPAQQQAVVYILTHYQNSPTLTAALQHMSNEGVATIELRMDSVAHLYDGTTRPFVNSVDTGQPSAAVISYDYLNQQGTDIREGSTAIITINSNFAMDLHSFAQYLIHEILHPYIS